MPPKHRPLSRDEDDERVMIASKAGADQTYSQDAWEAILAKRRHEIIMSLPRTPKDQIMDSTAAARDSQVPNQLKSLEGSLSDLKACIEAIAERIAPVLRVEPNEPHVHHKVDVPENQIRENMAPLAQSIENHCHVIAMMNSNLQSLLDRIEL